jgi:tetratricopeptide (TPR) repeat protein
MNSRAGKLIEKAIKIDDWAGARRLIKAELKSSPKDHWLLSRLALTFYEQRQYKRALYWDARALHESPYCPMAIWGYAGALDMLGRHRQALSLYRYLLSWGEKQLAYGQCGEGIRDARSTRADCRYRIACIWQEKRQWKRAAAEYEKHLAARKKGHGSIYTLREVKRRYKDVLSKVSG